MKAQRCDASRLLPSPPVPWTGGAPRVLPGADGARSVRPAFTLLELLIVVALATVLATVAAVSFAGTYRAARARDVADQVARYDRLAREAARRFGRPGRITFDLDQGVISRTPAAAEAEAVGRAGEKAGPGDHATPAALHLPAGFRITRVVSAGTTATAGSVSLPCSMRGQTASYAVWIVGPKGDGSWLVVAGLTGKVRPALDANEVEDIFRSLAAGRPGGAEPDAGAPAEPSPPGAGDDAR